MLTQRDRVGILVPPLEAEEMEAVGAPPPLARVGQQVQEHMWVQEQWGVLIAQVQKLEVEVSQALVEKSVLVGLLPVPEEGPWVQQEQQEQEGLQPVGERV